MTQPHMLIYPDDSRTRAAIAVIVGGTESVKLNKDAPTWRDRSWLQVDRHSLHFELTEADIAETSENI